MQGLSGSRLPAKQANRRKDRLSQRMSSDPAGRYLVITPASLRRRCTRLAVKRGPLYLE